MTPQPAAPKTSKARLFSKILPWLITSTAITMIAAMSNPAHAIEEPAYTVVQKTEVFEVRQYAPYLVAEVIVPGPASEAGNQGFNLLGGYIFGKNKGERKLEMTAPVTQTPLEPAAPVKLEMTAPVTQSPAPGGFAVQFVMPKGYTLATLPEPLDARVKLREVAGQRVAVIRFSGSWSQSIFEEQLQALRAALATAGIQTQGEPVSSRYNSPFSLPFLRRNEIWLNLV
jgi:SOUL heme-binding protein